MALTNLGVGSCGALRIGVIGACRRGPELVRTLMETPGATCAAVADSEPERLATIAERYARIATTLDHRMLLADRSIEAVCIASPAATHRRFALEALAAGKHVFVEQPFATSVEDAEAIFAASYSAARLVVISHTPAHDPAVEAVRALVRHGALGNVRYVDSERASVGIHHRDVNVLWDLGPDEVATILYWLGAYPEWVQCAAATETPDALEDVALLTLGFASGAIAHLTLSWLAPTGVQRITLIGSSKTAIYDQSPSAERLRVYEGTNAHVVPDELWQSSGPVNGLSSRIPSSEPLRREMRHFLACVRGESLPQGGGEAGLHTVRVLEAASRSLRAGGIRVACECRGLSTPLKTWRSMETGTIPVANA